MQGFAPLSKYSRFCSFQPNSPASKAGLVSFFDFLVGANGAMLLGSGEGLEEGEEYDDIDFPALLHENRGRPVELCRYFSHYMSLTLILVLTS